MAKSASPAKKSPATRDLFAEVASPRPAPKRAEAPRNGNSYTAHDIEVLEGLEPVRRRPGMYIGGTDEKALHHLFAEVIDNAMDEALAGHATFIEVDLAADGTLAVTDNGRGIPVDPHPKFPKKSALEVVMCTLHRRRQVRLQCVRDLGRPARRRRLGGQRAVGAARGRGGAGRPALPPGVCARHTCLHCLIVFDLCANPLLTRSG